jgi:hypothetical protein
MPVSTFLQWLADTSFSGALRDSTWAEPVIETIHVLTLTIFLGFTVLLDLRLLGVTMHHKRVSEVFNELNPPIIDAFLLMVATGGLLFCGDPVSFYGTIFFRVKMTMLVLALANILIFRLTLGRHMGDWEQNPNTPAMAKLAAVLSLVLWAAIIAAGRAIAYAVPPP